MMTTQEMNGITGFTPAQALADFRAALLDDDLVGAWVNAKLHPGGEYACPACGTVITSDRARDSFSAGRRVCCLGCKKYFTNRTNTFLLQSSLEFGPIYLLAVLTALKVPRKEIARIVGLSPDGVRLWQKKFELLETPLV